ncbi:phosphoethanolamine--lipid A transferase [Vibrio fluvialis]|uniref:phosphoethanolamine transferase n=1 Tax=Vibrio fluvialis TaxID=676 RepID=UPI000509F804|nr:phosphoethanolamine--lipid A transferase [Vibrio fluvialis]EKO3484859.1 phosphoethanolamine--lipid A transferase [Vibrio fluvialis]MBY7972455.1 phosphoethanolamine--lipid A transferase [Vibrio fluvialis]MBY8085136.1 phosphoethanolamine--lipid A transferase [Vibrio fluvialis]
MTTLIVVFAAYFGTVMNYPVLKTIFHLSADVSNPLFAYTAPLLLTCAFIIIFSAFAWPYFFKPIMTFVVLTSAGALYAQVNFDTLFDTTMMESIFETNSSEVSFYLNISTALYVVVFGVIPCLFLWMVRIVPRRTLLGAIGARISILVIALAGIALIGATSYKDYASVGRNNHYLNKMINPAHIFNGAKYLKKTYFTEKLVYQEQGKDAQVPAVSNGKPTLMVVVLGETARAMNFAYNGYNRNTNPYTKDMGLIAFQDVSSCGTYTALSVPCMFSNMTRDTYNKPRAAAQDNALNVLQHAGVDVLWIDNDGGDKGVADKLPYISIDASLKNNDCNGSTCFDVAMMTDAKKFIDDGSHNKLLVLHTIGSHGPTYWQRYPDAQAPFQPACNRSDIENCDDQQIVNVYDNTLVYTDYVLAQVINELKSVSNDYNVMLTYISDHGESLGESGLYLHGTPYAIAPKEQTHVPWLLWMPEEYAQQKHLDKTCLEQEAQSNSVSHDNLFHSLLGLYGVRSQVRDPKLDITQRCLLNS